MSASEASREDRQLEASQRRIEQARAQGQLPRSRELVHLAASGSLLAVVMAAGGWIAHGALALLAGGLRFDQRAAFDSALMLPRLGAFATEGLSLLVPVCAAIAAVLGATSVAVGGWNFTLQALQAKPDRIDPLAGLGRLFSLRGIVEHARVLLVAAALLAAGGHYLWLHAADLQGLARMPLVSALDSGRQWVTDGLWPLAGVALASALVDIPLQIWRQRSELRMTHDEAKQEHKESEGDPHVKGQRRRRARELARGRMLADVPHASVVVTNPTHYAVALRYDADAGGAPRVVAKGADLVALRIREIARDARVPVLESPPLARAAQACRGRP